MKNIYFKNEIIKKVLEKYKVIWSLHYLNGLAGWDARIYMPKKGIIARGKAHAQASKLIQQFFLDKEFVYLINKASEEKNLNVYEKGVLRILRKDLDQYQKLPIKFTEKCAEITNKAQSIWENAKNNDDFKSFAPILGKIIKMCQEKSEIIGYKSHPYDVHIDDFEHGMTTHDVDMYFDSIKGSLIKMLAYINKSKKYIPKHILSSEIYSKHEMNNLNNSVLDYLGADRDRFRMDISSHPFTQGFGPNDVRITTWYHDKDFASSLTATIHEFGHSLYELESIADFEFTPLSGGNSLSIHESLSRFWENIVARSYGFAKFIHKDLIKLGENYKKYSTSDIYKYLNIVSPGLIRVDADEITYHFHILIRFELEKDLIKGKLKVKDLPDAWNALYKKYLGIKPLNYKDGVLQDIHWSAGLIGYFPTYSIGTVLSSIWMNLIEKDIGSINKLVESKSGINKLRNWLQNNIHKYGSSYDFKDMVKKVSKNSFNTTSWKKYLKKKYSTIY